MEYKQPWRFVVGFYLPADLFKVSKMIEMFNVLTMKIGIEVGWQCWAASKEMGFDMNQPNWVGYIKTGYFNGEHDESSKFWVHTCFPSRWTGPVGPVGDIYRRHRQRTMHIFGKTTGICLGLFPSCKNLSGEKCPHMNFGGFACKFGTFSKTIRLFLRKIRVFLSKKHLLYSCILPFTLVFVLSFATCNFREKNGTFWEKSGYFWKTYGSNQNSGRALCEKPYRSSPPFLRASSVNTFEKFLNLWMGFYLHISVTGQQNINIQIKYKVIVFQVSVVMS